MSSRDAITEALDGLQDKLARDVAAAAAPPFTVVCDSRDRAAWLKARRETIGASESPIVLGCSPWSSALALWADKTGRAVREEPPVEPEWTFWGNVLEEAIIAGYAKRTGRTTLPFGLLLRSTRWPWLSATPDALVTGDPEAGARAPQISRTIGHIRAAIKKGADVSRLVPELIARTAGWWPLQIKNIGFTSADHWRDGVPLYYEVQCVHEALVFGASHTTAAALVAGQKLAWDDVSADPAEILPRQIVHLTERFMLEHVVAGVEPPADGTDSARAALLALYPREEPEKVVALGAEMMALAERIDQLKASQKAAAEEAALYENQIRQAMGAAERCVLPDNSGYTYKANVNGSRVLSRKPCKGRE